MTLRHQLNVNNLCSGYGEKTILEDINLEIIPGKITTIIGANACGKSTLLRTMSRLISPHQGQVLLDGKSIHKSPTRELAKTLGLLPQSPIAPEGITVADLVSRGRHPHHGLISRWSKKDDEIVAQALETTKTTELMDRGLDELSGGQRQRVWIAMALAQKTDILLLDEPTTFLDVTHQIEILDLLIDLNKSHGTTIILVLHDLNLASRYSDQLIAIQQGQVLAHDSPSNVITEELVHKVFGLNNQIITDPVSNTPLVLPIGRHHRKDET